LFVDIISISCENAEAAQAGVDGDAPAWATGPGLSVACRQNSVSRKSLCGEPSAYVSWKHDRSRRKKLL